MHKLISTCLLSGTIFFICFAALHSNCPAQEVAADALKKEQRRAAQLLARSNYGFVKTKSPGTGYAEALWRADYYSKVNRIRISVFIFSNRELAQKYGVEFYTSTRKQEQRDRMRGGEFIRYGYLYNEGILFLVSGYDDERITRLLPLLARKHIK